MLNALFLLLNVLISFYQDHCEGAQVDGMKHGYWKCHYEDGTLQEEGEYNKDQKTGHWKIYHTTGKVALEGNYKNGQEIGPWQVFDEEGNLIDTIEYGN